MECVIVVAIITTAIIATAIVIIVLIIAFVPDGDDTGEFKMNALARDAAHLFSDMRVPMTMSALDEVDILTTSTKRRIDDWLARYKKEINK